MRRAAPLLCLVVTGCGLGTREVRPLPIHGQGEATSQTRQVRGQGFFCSTFTLPKRNNDTPTLCWRFAQECEALRERNAAVENTSTPCQWRSHASCFTLVGTREETRDFCYDTQERCEYERASARLRNELTPGMRPLPCRLLSRRERAQPPTRLTAAQPAVAN
jgi:hypothetical protein